MTTVPVDELTFDDKKEKLKWFHVYDTNRSAKEKASKVASR
jgi:hypothetical protein